MLMKFLALPTVTLVVLSTAISAGAALADPRGLWLAQDGARVRVSSCGRALCGTIASSKSAVDPATGQPWTDKHNPDPAKRSRPLVGVQVFAMMPDGQGKWSGSLYNADDGHTYQGHVLETDRNTIRVEGCAGLCGGQNMKRLE
jgi:uncharacterized protein (DUF2147 family)